MGFLDFLKRPDPIKASAPQKEVLPPPGPSPDDLSHDEWKPSASQAPFDDNVPLPPVTLQDPNFLSSGAAPKDLPPPPMPPSDVPQLPVQPTLLPPPPVAPSPALSDVSPPVAPQPAVPEKPPIAAIEFPDFTDDDLKFAEKMPEPPAETPSRPKAPASDEPPQYISTATHFAVLGEYKGMRKGLRLDDDILKNLMLHHEQIDAQYKRIALDMNNIQEQLMKIDGALFES